MVRLFGALSSKRRSRRRENLVREAFDNQFYKTCNPDIDFESISPVEHFLHWGWREGRDPTSWFSTSAYLQVHKDVREKQLNPFAHYLEFGRKEGRAVSESGRTLAVQDARHADDGTQAKEAATGSVWHQGLEKAEPDGRSEWSGYTETWRRGTPSLEGTEPDSGVLSFTVSASGMPPARALVGAHFGRTAADAGDPRVSVIIPCLNEELVTAECLLSISQSLPESFRIEILVADNASTDPLYLAISRHPELRHIRFEANLGFGRACNAAAGFAQGEFLFFLNNDAQIAPGCLEALLAVMTEQGDGAAVGIVGPKLLSFDGRLQEAGCVLNSDGTASLVGYAADHRTPRFNYRRNVEHISGAAIMISKALFAETGGFDDAFAPAYCEDVDLCLKVRQKGYAIIYEPAAVVAHHMSRTFGGNDEVPNIQSKRQRIARNRNTLVKRWPEALSSTGLRTIAFYLPQYHPIPENDLWWGKGFTEWTNVTKARPNYVGHDQPRYPADLGYYDLRVPEVLEQQAALARRYGLHGFCYYYYWFDGKRILERPLEHMLATGKPDLPFCLCWANENWTRRWDGRDTDVLVSQTYSGDYAVRIIADLSRYFRSKSYIRVDGLPLVLIYRIKDVPIPHRLIATWRNFCRDNGIGEILVAMVESMELSAKPEDPTIYGCDVSVEFPIHGMVHDPEIAVERLTADVAGRVHDYRELAAAFMRRIEPGFPRFRSVTVGWDSTPRHGSRSLVLEHASPGAFQAWLEWTYRRTLEQAVGDRRLVFINAWNEWGEGSYMEPDRRHGHAYLQALRNALSNAAAGGEAFAI